MELDKAVEREMYGFSVMGEEGEEEIFRGQLK